MVCPRCHTPNPDGTLTCAGCRTPLECETQVITTSTHPGLEPGDVLGGRYEILQVLGQGGMGVVYKARDRELDRDVALKIIRPELANRPDILRRFKDELVLARQVTHHNVIRIYDLGVADGRRFISMELLEGEDLGAVLQRRGKLPPQEAAGLFRQIAEGLAAAHAEQVIHRDLKPRNIMLDAHGRAAIMDFGIARSIPPPDATATAQLVGTPVYMSPEQARGNRLDARSDLFSAGIIFYELLTGALPFQADTVMGTLLKRVQERPKAPHEVDAAIPQALSRIVMKCLAVDPAARYQQAGEIVRDLDAWQAPPPPRYPRWALAAGPVLLLAAAALIYQQLRVPRAPPRAQPPVTLLVADFDNDTADPLFNGTLESTLSIALEEVPFLNLIDPNRARRIAPQVQPGATRLNEAVARLVAVREGIRVVVHGSVARDEAGYRISLQALEGLTGKTILTRNVRVKGKQGVLAALNKLAATLRKALGDRKPESQQLEAAETFTAASLEAAHSYAQAQQLQTQGKWKEAIGLYADSIKYDPNLGRAYAGMAAMYHNLNQRQQAEQYYKLAMSHIDRMTDREKYRTRGGYYLAMRNYQKAAEQYSGLVKEYPADAAGYSNLALAYFFGRDMKAAQETGRRAIEISPKNVPQRNNLALFALYAGDFPTAEREARAVLQLSASFEQAYVTLAMALLGQGKPQEAMETYRRVEALGGRGASLAATGLADLALYEGRLADARTILEKGIEADLAAKNTETAAEKMATLASVHLLRSESGKALDWIGRAVAAGQEDIVRYGAARIYMEAGQEEKARSLADQFGARLEPDPEAYAKLLEGERLLKHELPREAIRVFGESQKLADTWLGRYGLGRAFLSAGRFAEADAEFDACLRRRGEATAVFLDDVPTYRYLAPVYYYLGIAREGLKSPGAAEAFSQFLAIQKGGEGPLIAEARRHFEAR